MNVSTSLGKLADALPKIPEKGLHFVTTPQSDWQCDDNEIASLELGAKLLSKLCDRVYEHGRMYCHIKFLGPFSSLR